MWWLVAMRVSVSVCVHKRSCCLAAGRGHLKLDNLRGETPPRLEIPNLHASWSLAECLQGAQTTLELPDVTPPLEAALEYVEAEHEELRRLLQVV